VLWATRIVPVLAGQLTLGQAYGLTEKQLSSAESLEGATVPDEQILRGEKTPNGPTFEDWLKDKEGRKEDGENG
jgi:hypothetical protein